MNKLLCLSIGCITLFFSCKTPNSKIIKQIKDERGLTSIVLVQGKDTFAFDYLTKNELDSLKK